MKKVNKFLNYSLILSSLLSITSCNESKDESSTATDIVDIISFKDTTIYGYVDSINDKTISLTIGSLIEMQNNQGDIINPNQEINSDQQSENPPEQPGEEGQTSESGQQNPPDMPSGEEGQTSESGQQNPPDMQSGEEQTLNPGQGNESQKEIPSDNSQTTGDFNPQENVSSNLFYKSSTTAIIIVTNENLLFDSNDKQISIDSIVEGSIISVVVDSNSTITKIQVIDASLYDFTNNNPGTNINPGDDQKNIPGGQEQSITYNALNTFTENTTINDTTYNSTGTDEEAILVDNGATVIFNNITITKTSTDSTGGDNSSFYGVGAGLLVVDGTSYINSSTINTDSKGGAGVFSYDQGVVYVAGTTIDTKESTSGGIHVAGGGTLYAYDLTITTSGESSAAIRSDRGGGNMVVDGGSYTSNGTGSPAIYCTADIAVNNANLVANNSEGICVEGLNSLFIYDSSLTSNMQDLSQNDTTWSIIVYQSMSGDSEIGNSNLHIIDSSINALNGGVFYTTNTECSILLENTTITTNEDSEFFLQCTGNTNSRGWGSVGSNGSDCLFTARNQVIDGNIIWDKASTLDFYLLDSSTITGKIYDDETWAGGNTSGECSLYIDASSTWVVSEDSIVTNLNNAGSIVDSNGNLVTIVDEDGKVLVQGTSTLKVTVLGNYSNSVTTTNALKSSTFDSFKVEKPTELA